MTTQVTLAFTATTSPNVLASQLQSALAAVTLPTGDMVNFGLTLTSDNTTAGVGSATRTIIFSTLPPFISYQVGSSCNGGGYISIVSSSADDGPGGAGMLVAQIPYNDPNVKPKTVQVVMNGPNPVSPPPRDIVTVTGITPVEGNAASGLITVTVGKNGKGAPLFQLLGNFQGSVVSSSPNDTAGGIGAQQIQVTYHDKAGAGPFTENANLAGTTPVNFINTNHASINNITITAEGSQGTSIGIISIFSGPNGTGALIAQLGQSYFGLFPPTTIVAPGLDGKGNVNFGVPTTAATPTAADQAGLLRQLYSMALSAGIGSAVTSAEPVFS